MRGVDGAGNVSLQNGGNDISIAVTAKNGSVRTYTIHVVKQDGGPTQGSGGSPVYGGGSSSGRYSQSGRQFRRQFGRQFRQQRSGRFRRTGQSFRKRQRTRRKQCDHCRGAVLIKGRHYNQKVGNDND